MMSHGKQQYVSENGGIFIGDFCRLTMGTTRLTKLILRSYFWMNKLSRVGKLSTKKIACEKKLDGDDFGC